MADVVLDTGPSADSQKYLVLLVKKELNYWSNLMHLHSMSNPEKCRPKNLWRFYFSPNHLVSKSQNMDLRLKAHHIKRGFLVNVVVGIASFNLDYSEKCSMIFFYYRVFQYSL